MHSQALFTSEQSSMQATNYFVIIEVEVDPKRVARRQFTTEKKDNLGQFTAEKTIT